MNIQLRQAPAQRTPEWFLERRGKITASEAFNILGFHNESVPMTEKDIEEFRTQHPRARIPETKSIQMPFSQKSFTYLDSRIAESCMPRSEYLEYIEYSCVETRATKWGTDYESTARSRYESEFGIEVLECPFIPLGGYEMFAGGSPDGVIRYSDGIIEIKCPYNPAVHLRHCLCTKPEDLLNENEQYYVQCQYNMLVCERDFETPVNFCDFISFDPRVSKKLQLKVLRIPKDEKMQNLLLERTELAIKYITTRIEEIESAMDKKPTF